VVVVDGNGNPVDITWNGNHPASSNTATIPPTISQVASISGFLSRDENLNTRHVIVARNDTGEVYDIDFSHDKPVPTTVGQNYLRTRFNEQLKNVTAFFSSESNYRHIVVLTQQNWLKDHAYNTYGTNETNIQLVQNNDIVDITSFYSTQDRLCHVLYVTKDGYLYEITYTSQG